MEAGHLYNITPTRAVADLLLAPERGIHLWATNLRRTKRNARPRKPRKRSRLLPRPQPNKRDLPTRPTAGIRLGPWLQRTQWGIPPHCVLAFSARASGL